jgi:hypothetical protein
MDNWEFDELTHDFFSFSAQEAHFLWDSKVKAVTEVAGHRCAPWVMSTDWGPPQPVGRTPLKLLSATSISAKESIVYGVFHL